MIPLCRPIITEADKSAVMRTMDDGFVSGAGQAISDFEEALATTVGEPHVVVCSSGTAGLHLALLDAGVRPGKEVVTSDLTFAATANAAKYCGAEVTLVDSKIDDWNLDGELLLDEIDSRAKAGKRLPTAVVVVDIVGVPVDREPFEEIRQRFDILIVEDAAEALGASWSDGMEGGAFGDWAVLSFNGNKIITSGNGGAVVAPSAESAERIRHLANQAKLPGVGYNHDAVGYNYRLSSLNAALGNSQLSRLGQLVTHKRHIFKRYRDALGSYGFVGRLVADRNPSEWLSSFLLPNTYAGGSDSLVHALAGKGIEARPMWTPLHQMKPFEGSSRIGGGVADEIRRRGISLPCSADLTEQDQDRVIESVIELVDVGGSHG